MATLKELSERTGYSAATISRILNGDTTLSVSDETRRRVLEEAGRINYTATRSRRGRTPKRTLRVGVAEHLTPVQQLDDPYYLFLANYVRQECLDKKYTYLPMERRGSGFALHDSEALSGIVAIGSFSTLEIESLGALTPNVVFMDTSPFESLYDSVLVGYELGISLALEHLENLHHKRIAFVGPSYNAGNRKQWVPEMRRRYFIQMMRARGILEKELLIECPMRRTEAKETIGKFLHCGPKPPTAILCANEESAIGTVLAIQEAGLSVPGDISVVSFDDTPKSTLVEPLLTSVSTHVEEMAKTALRLLAERACTGPGTPVRTFPLKVIVPPSLEVRDSTAPAKEDVLGGRSSLGASVNS